MQATNTDKLLGHDNHSDVGGSFDYGVSNFGASAQLGVINSPFSPPGRRFSREPGNYFGPVSLRTTNAYTGVYAFDTFDVTNALSISGGGLTRANNPVQDQPGGRSTATPPMRFNPMIGATYKINSDLTAYAGYSEANRAPTPLELGCADPVHPCIIASFLVSDPALKQVVAQTLEAGLRGQHAFGEYGKLQWSAGLFRTTLANDILPLQSPANGFGYYANVGTTLRQGTELSAQWSADRWTAYANYTYIDAVYLSTFMEPSPFNPAANSAGLIPITNGTPIAGIPKNTVKVGVDYNVTDKWKIGGDMVAASGQTIFGKRERRVAAGPRLRCFRRARLLSGQQAIAGLWPRTEHIQPAL